MKKILVLVLFLLPQLIFSQNSFKAVIKDAVTKESLTGVIAFLQGTKNGSSADVNGSVEIKNIPDGKQVIVFSALGYQTRNDTFHFPLISSEPVIVFLSPTAAEIEGIVVEATRSNKSIENIPTRVEVLTEEIDEASTMDPSKVAHLLTHSTGIQVQQTSATSNTANVRIQGLDGRYTQILKDGFPLYGGFSGSLSIMQIPPLDLRQIEYIKGSASTLYGGGAIAGLINLISKEPTHEETLFHLNASQVGALDVNTFMSRMKGKMGFTLLAQKNSHRPFDANKDGFTDLPMLTKYNLNPKVFFYFSPRTKLYVGGTFTNEIRQGGDVDLLGHRLSDSLNFYKEVNDISRVTSQVKLDHKFSASTSVSLRNSFNVFHREIEIIPSYSLGEYRFSGEQVSSFSEAAFTFTQKENVLIAGVNFYTDDFNEEKIQGPFLRNENYETVGGFANYTFELGKKVALETGLRADHVFGEKLFILPRISSLFKWTTKLTTRVGGGMGYRNPSIFNQEAELLGYRNVKAIDYKQTAPEESYGGSADVGFKTNVGNHFFISFNQMFFYSNLERPLVLTDTGSNSGIYHFINADGFTQSYGAETFFKFGFYDFVFFAGYTYTHATHHFNDTVMNLTLTPQHSLKGDLLYALPGKWRIGVDYEFKSGQTLSTGRVTRSYWTYGAVVERTWRQYTLFCNTENITNVKQADFESLISSPYNTPQFTEVWAPLDGFVINCGIKIRL